jgi:energy-coupling factor transporter ATP-binding protein EcfA2
MPRPVLRLWAHHRPTVLLVTHDVDEALVLAGRVLVLADGRIAFGRQVTVPRPRERDHPGLIAPRTRLLAELGVATALFRISHTVEALFSRPGQPACRGSAVAPAGILAGQAFHVSSRQASRSHAASRMVRRNMNRRHMTDDHHGRTAARATLLVRAMDEILGTHNLRLRPSARPLFTLARCSWLTCRAEDCPSPEPRRSDVELVQMLVDIGGEPADQSGEVALVLG